MPIYVQDALRLSGSIVQEHRWQSANAFKNKLQTLASALPASVSFRLMQTAFCSHKRPLQCPRIVLSGSH